MFSSTQIVTRSKHHLLDVSDFLLSKRIKAEEYPAGNLFKLNKPAGATFRTAGLDDNVYKDCFVVVNGWGKFYLPKSVNMEVVGVVEGISCPCNQLVLMTCEDKKIYAYDEERLHLVATSRKQLLCEGMDYPASKTYYYGEAFKDMPTENWKDTKRSSLGRRLDEEYKKMVAARKSSLLENLEHNRTRLPISC